MKRLLIYIGIAIAAIGCTKDSEVDLASSNNALTISSEIATRSSDKTSWEGNESIGVYMTTAGSALGNVGANYEYTNSIDAANIFTSDTPIYYPDNNNLAITAYYPYDADLVTSSNKYSIELSDQIDLLVAEKYTLSVSSSAVDMTFEHKLSKITLSITTLGSGLTLDDLKDVEVKLSGNLLADATYSLSEGRITNTGSLLNNSNSLTLKTTNSTTDTNTNSVVADGIVLPYDGSGGTIPVTFTLKGDSSKVFTGVLPNNVFEPGTQYNYTAKVGYNTVEITKSSIEPWGDPITDDGTADIVDIEYKIDDTYYINSAKGLAAFRDLVNNVGKNSSSAVIAGFEESAFDETTDYTSINGKLTRDIDLSSICYAADDNNAVASWSPIGSASKKITGTFDGCGYKISGLYVYSSVNQQSLFGNVDTGGVICNLGVSGEVTGTAANNTYNEIGGIVAYNSGYIINCYSSITVTAGVRNVGGIAAFSKGSVVNCYNQSKVTGYLNIGGIVGQNAGYVGYCYNTGAVTMGTSYDADVRCGGVVGYNNTTAAVSVKGSFCLDNTILSIGQVGVTASTGTIGTNVCDETYLKSESFVTTINNSCKSNYEGEGTPCGFVAVDGGYPTINFDKEVEFNFVDISYNGVGYNIYSGKGLRAFAALVNGETTLPSGLVTSGDYDSYFKFSTTAQPSIGGSLENDISLLDVCNVDNDGTSWTPIGTGDTISGMDIENTTNICYSGTFNGGGFLVSDLYINASSSNYRGLFGYVKNGTVYDLGVSGSSVTGDTYVGGVAGSNSGGTIVNCYNTCKVYGSEIIGGVVGWNNSIIANCYNSGTVTNSTSDDTAMTGGVAGYSDTDGNIYSSYNSGSLSADGNYTGGVVGNNSGGSVSGGYYISGTTDYVFGNSSSTTNIITVNKDANGLITSLTYGSSTLVDLLNNAAKNYSGSNPTACQWITGDDGYPTLNFGTDAQ
ncbi:MAG: fimbrillin family protein [Rikenellaceae bacterium]